MEQDAARADALERFLQRNFRLRMRQIEDTSAPVNQP